LREALLAPFRVIRYSAANAWADMWVMFTPVSWTFGYLSRLLTQVIFFALIGVLLDSPDLVRFLFIGNAVMFMALEAFICVASTTWERRQGTLPLLVAAPGPLWPVFVGRSVQWLPTGLVSSSTALFALGPFFGVTWRLPQALAVFGALVVIGVAMYCMALVFGALVLAAMEMRNMVYNVATYALMAICGVMVPLAFWPDWVGTVANAVPLTHGLAAVRTLAESPTVGPVAGEVVTALFVSLGIGAVWLLVAAVLLERLAMVGRRTGSIEFAA
jgi:ABC-2 type transport system permease protein